MKNHSSRFLALVDEAKKNIKEISPQALKHKIDHKEHFTLIDVREDHEWTSGHIPTAEHISKGTIERDIEKKIHDTHTPLVVYCSGGLRCALVAESLQKMGYSDVYSLATGMQGWVDEGFSLKK